MNTRRCGRGTAWSVWAAASAWAVGMGWAAPRGLPPASRAVEDGTAAPRPQTPRRTPQPVGEGAGQESQAKRIARERFQFLKRLEAKFSGLPIYSMGGDYCDVAIFPVGRADRLYLFLWFDSDEVPTGNYVYCYQRKDGKDELVYRLTLDPVDGPAKQGKGIKSLLDYIHLAGHATLSGHKPGGGYVIEGRISRFARNDLAVRREYALYCCDIMNDVLQVGLLSDVEVGSVLPVKVAHYDTAGEYFERYGLPVSRKEMALIRDGRK